MRARERVHGADDAATYRRSIGTRHISFAKPVSLPGGTRIDLARFTDGDAPRSLAFAPSDSGWGLTGVERVPWVR